LFFPCPHAEAQFSFPYDPDFAQQKAPEKAPEPAPAAAEQPEAPPAPRTPMPESLRKGPFLLLDRKDASRIFEPLPAASTAPPKDFDEFLRELEPFRYSPDAWNKMREDVEYGILPREEIELPPPPSGLYEVAGATGAPLPPRPELELPTYGTTLSITGRKLIGFSYTEKRFLREQRITGRPKSTNLIDITQQLQLRMQGKVGPKITVNVDYDDTKVNKQDISVVYTGDPNEVVQNASFGDIDLSLPATEFVSYNKQLFGIRIQLKYRKLSAIFIGSRTKGQTKTKQFKGNTQLVSMDVLDTSYIRRQYYDLTFGNPARLPLRAGSEKVYLSRRAQGQQNVGDITLTVDDLMLATATYTGIFTQLVPGTDYTLDHVKGILTFRNTLDAQDVVAVDFTDAGGLPISVQTSTVTGTSGGTGRNKLIKTFADVKVSTDASSPEVGWQRELKTFYSIGRSQIVRDDGRGNFFLKVLDLNRAEVGSLLDPVQKYPDTITVDFENGVFRLDKPFAVVGDTSTPDPDVYSPTPLSKRILQMEFRFRLKTFFLEPNLVLQSEVVLVDGARLSRNADYFIDYESGFITFFNEDRIKDQSVIDVSYEVAPFAGAATESLLGTRLWYDFNEHFSVGSTLLYQTGSKPPSVPTVSELAKSLLVYEGDLQLKNLKLLPFLQASFAGEYARSHMNPNLSKRALIENMEGVKQDDIAGLIDTNWQVAANPDNSPADPNAMGWSSPDVPILLINPQAPATSNETQKVLQLTYDFSVAGTTDEVSLVYPFSPTGLDFTQKTILEVQMYQGAATNNEINFHLGGINEDADGRGGTTLTCADGRVLTGSPKTEDLNCDGILHPDEDNGFDYSPLGMTSARYGAGNGRIDTMDLNRNGRLDPADFSGGDFGYSAPGGGTSLYDVTSGSTRTKLDFTGWHTFQIPITIPTADAAKWTAVKQLRISLRRGAGGSAASSIQFARIAVIGNSWQRGQAGDPFTGASSGGTVTVKAVNNSDDPNYLPIYKAGGEAQDVFNDLYGTVDELQKQSNSTNIQEQALEIRFSNLTSTETVYTKRTFNRALDISQHKSFSFLLYGNAQARDASPTPANTDKTFFLRAGSDKDFFEIRVPLNFTGWRKVVAEQVDTTGDQIPDRWNVGPAPSGATVFSTGTPKLQQIAQLTAGVYSNGNTTNAGALWLDEIHLADPITRTGNAQKLQMDFTVPGWGSFGARYRYVDRHYQTPTSVVANQDNRADNAYLKFDRLSFFPMNFTLQRLMTITPNANATSDRSNLVSLMSQGKVTTWNGAANGSFSLGAWPRLSLGYTRDRTEYDELTRLDDRKTYNGSMDYTVPREKNWLPRTVGVSASHAKYSVSFESPFARAAAGNYNTDEFTNSYGLRLAFVPWAGSSFNPNYNITAVREDRLDFTSGREVRSSYDKSRTQTAGFTANFQLLKWLNPSVNYNLSTIENYVLQPTRLDNGSLAVASYTVAGATNSFAIGAFKAVNRTASGGLTLSLTASEIVPRSKLLRSFTLINGYQLQDGDVYSNVEGNLNTRTAFWIRTPLRTHGPAAQRVNLTLRDTLNSTQRWSPLEAYDIEGRKAAFKTFSITNNFVKSLQRSEVTGTRSKTVSTTLPDLLASLSQIERLLFTDRWMRNGQINLKYSARQTENVGQSLDSDDSLGTDLRALIREKFDTSFSFNYRTTGKKDLRIGQVVQTTDHKDLTLQSTFDMRIFRMTPKLDYQQDVTTLGNGVQTQNTRVITPSLLARTDISLPKGLKVPFSSKTLAFTNRVIWTTTLSLAMRESPVTLLDNSKLFNLNSNADYEIAKNLRMTINGAVSRLWHKYQKEDEYMSYQFGTMLTFQF